MKCLILRRRTLTVLACALLAAAMFALVNAPAVAEASATDRQLPIYCVQRDQKMLAISFDAAWGNEDTQQLIDILGKYNVKATFFVVGDWVDKYPESVKALHDAGHEVMNHSNSHAHMSQLSSEAIVADVEACNDKIEAVTGVRPTLIRPPYGEYDNNVITSIRSIGMEPIQWDVDSLDWKDLPAGEITERVVSRVHRSLPQRRPPYPRGPARHPRNPATGGLHLRPHLRVDSPRGIQRGLHHRPHRPPASGAAIVIPPIRVRCPDLHLCSPSRAWCRR